MPGKASIDALSSFVCAPSVGVMITNNLYQKKIYTQREAVTITTCFSVCSLGAFAFLSGMANCGEYYSQLVLCALVLAFVMAAIMEIANQNAEVLRTLKTHIGMGLAGEKSEDNSIDLQIRIAEIDAEFKKMLDRVSTDTIEAFDEETATRLMNEKSRLQQQLDSIADAAQRRENAKSRLDDIYMILDSIKNRPMEYDDRIVRQLLECVVVDSKEQITVIFKGGLKSVQPLNE